MSAAPKIVVQTAWDVTIVDFQEARLLEAQQIEAIGKELYRLVDEMDRKKLILTSPTCSSLRPPPSACS